MKFFVWCLSLFFMAIPLITVAEDLAPASDTKIEVTSVRMEADQQNGKVIFTGEVVGRRGAMTIYSDQLTLFFNETEGKRRIDHLEAAGNVRVVEGQRIATAQRLEYVDAEEKLALYGDAEIHQAGDLISGDEIVLFLRENRSLVKSDKDGRVKAVFLPAQAQQ